MFYCELCAKKNEWPEGLHTFVRSLRSMSPKSVVLRRAEQLATAMWEK